MKRVILIWLGMALFLFKRNKEKDQSIIKVVIKIGVKILFLIVIVFP